MDGERDEAVPQAQACTALFRQAKEQANQCVSGAHRVYRAAFPWFDAATRQLPLEDWEALKSAPAQTLWRRAHSEWSAMTGLPALASEPAWQAAAVAVGFPAAHFAQTPFDKLVDALVAWAAGKAATRSQPIRATPRAVYEKGIACPQCKSTKHRVWYARRYKGYVLRRKVCIDCGRKLVTIERLFGTDPDVHHPTAERGPNNKECATKHAPDFRSVRWFGAVYSFTPKQAACVRALWEAWENGTPELSGITILETAEVDDSAGRFPKVFRDSPAWGKMIVPGSTKGTYRLCAPPV